MSEDFLRIALFTYSTKPRGGVMHTIYLAEALQELGHEVCIFALAKPEAVGFSRPVSCPTVFIPSLPLTDANDVETLVKQRIQEFVQHLEQPNSPVFDIYHAQDCISANALKILCDRKIIPHFVRTVHHIDDFNNVYLQQCQDRSVLAPDRCFCVSQHWQAQLWQQYQVKAARVINGVDTQRFTVHPNGEEAALKATLGLNGSPIYLTVGGVEPRKNSIRLVQAFAQVLLEKPAAQLVIAGGDTFFDYTPYREAFFATVTDLGLRLGASLIVPGVLGDVDLPVLYRCADAFVFPSVKEGWGMVVLEAIASGLPVLTANIPPFTEFLTPAQALLVDPEDPVAIATGILSISQNKIAQGLIQQSREILDHYTWSNAAQMHLQHYHQLIPLQTGNH